MYRNLITLEEISEEDFTELIIDEVERRFKDLDDREWYLACKEIEFELLNEYEYFDPDDEFYDFN